MEPERSESPAPAPDLAWMLRPMEPGDRAFVESSWRRNYDYAPCPGGVDEYIATQSQMIASCLATSDVLVAHPQERHEQILGWACFRRPSTVHYVYVKPYYRRAGIGRALLEHAVDGVPKAVYITHQWRRPHAEGIGVIAAGWMRGGGVIEYNPALIFGATKQEWMPR
jgi:ribosomal protein S18 acetylase RimI-like enzyme